MVAWSDWRSRRPWVAFAIAIGLVTAPSLARAGDWHVEPGASGNGTEAAPFGSLNEALAAATVGDAGPSAIADAGPAGGGADGGGPSGAAEGGCGCRSAGPGSRGSAWQLCLLGTLLLVAFGRARRRRAG